MAMDRLAADPTRRRCLAIAAVLTAAAWLYYYLLLTEGDGNPFGNELLGLLFNDMLAHLLRGEVSLDPTILSGEAFLKGGRTMAYWGIFPALLRVPLVPFHLLYDVQIARLSCWLAICVASGLLVAMLILVWRRTAAGRHNDLLFLLLVAGTLFGGIVPSSLASAYVYNEAVFWAAALALAFNAIVLRRHLRAEPPTHADLVCLALLAGLALNCRAIEGMGLALATGWILLLVGVSGGLSRTIAPALVLALLGSLCALVNQARWGSPLTFLDLHYHTQLLHDPQRMAALVAFGAVNAIRIPFALAYYFFGLTDWLGVPPHLGGNALYDGIEPPSSAFVLTAPLQFLLAGVGVASLLRKPASLAGRDTLLLGVLAGQSAGLVVLLSANYLAMRYRMDFVPVIALAATLGYRALARAVVSPATLRRAGLLTLLSIVAAHFSLIAYKETVQPGRDEARHLQRQFECEREGRRCAPAIPPPASAR